MAEAKQGKLDYPVDSPIWYDREANEKAGKTLWAAPFDARFPQQNQTKHCFMYYIDYQRCLKLKGEDYEPCEYFKKVYGDICPRFWVEKWDTWMSEGRFPHDFSKYEKK